LWVLARRTSQQWSNIKINKSVARSAPRGVWPRLLLILLSLLSPIANAVADDYPAPQCLPITSSRIYPRLELIVRGDFRRDLDLSARRNAKYFFSNIVPERGGSKFARAYFLTFGPVSVFFPEKECPMGCTAYLVRTNKRGSLVKPIFFVSHMVTAVFPISSWLFLAPDRERLIEISSMKRKSADYATEVRERKSLPAGYMFSQRFVSSCLSTGKFDDLETSVTVH
jgi:hypothetical protein